MRRRCILLFLLALSLSSAEKNEEFFSKKTFIKSRDGFMRLQSDEWKVKSENDVIIVAIRVSTKMKSGSFLRLIGSKESSKLFELRLGFDDSSLSVDLRDERGISIISLPFTFHLNSSEYTVYSIGVRVNPSTKELIYSAENDKEIVAKINKQLDVIDAKLEVIMGSDDGTSIVGCITLVSVTLSSLSSPLSHISTIAEFDTQSCAEVEGECAQRNCGKGICKELETSSCDCYGTGRAGPNCRSDIPSARLLSSMDETLKYIPVTGNDQRIERLAISFRFEEGGDEQGVVLSARLVESKMLTLYVVNGKGSLQIESDVSIGFDLDNSLKDHSLLLSIQSHSIVLQADKKDEKKVEIQCETDHCVEFVEISFGAEPQSNEVRRIGLNGCIWEIYADHNNILSMYYDGHPRISSPHKLTRCNGDKEDELFDVQDHPSSLMSQSLPQMEVDSPVLSPPVHDSILPSSILPSPSKKKKNDYPSTSCTNAVGDQCKNGSKCIIRNMTKECLCTTGFTGSNCEFSSIPRNCAEARDFYRSPDGPTLIDIDGSGPLPKSVVDCKNGVTTVINDMPERTVVHDTIEQHSQFVLSYRDLTPQQLQMIIQESQKCTQQVHYECARAALGFKKAKTQFTLAGSNKTVSRIGQNDKKCDGNVCVCEDDSLGEDHGVFESPDVGITKILAFRDHTIPKQNGVISVESLICTGHAGSDTPLRFTSPAGVLLSKHFDRDLFLQFRTASSKGIILSTSGVLKLTIDSQYAISVSLENSFSLTVQSPVRLNDTAWHLIVIEMINNQVRLSIDNVVEVQSIEGDLPALGQIQLGDPNEGFIGCLRSMRINNQIIDLHKEAQHIESEEVHLTCSDKCHSEMCSNDGECLENLLDPTAEPVCVCKYPQIQEGVKCEIDINKTPPVSFHGGHLKYEDLMSNLDGEIVLSFRTDQQQGLILFSHDHLNNFLQLHLASEIAVTLTLNNLEEVFTCTVEAEPGMEYSNMEWIQIVISHVDKSTILSVNGRLCFIHKERQLSTEYIKTYAHVETEIVKIPVGVHHTTTVNPFRLSYLGGVKEIVTKNGQVTLFARYDTTIPDFLGCIRGFKVGGNLIDLTHTTKGTRPEDPDLVQIGCEMGCSTVECGNGGHCGVEWTNFHPLFNNKAHCNCERTSYDGDDCTQDDSISLSSGISVQVDVKSYLDHYPLADKSHHQSLKIAFKSNKQPKTKETIATLYFKDESFFEIVLNRNGSIHVGSVRGEKIEVLTFDGNFSHGYRHFIVAQFKNDSSTAILIDSTRHDLPWATNNLDLFDVVSLTLGTPIDSRFIDAQRDHFDGCVSNVELDYQITAVNIQPIAELYNASTTRWSVTSLHPSTTTLDDIRLHSCGTFKENSHLPGLASKVDFPEWDTNFGRLVYSGLWMEGGEETSSFPWWILILILIAIIAISILIYYLCFKKSPPPKKVPEEIPLNPKSPVISSPIPNKPASNFNIPEPDSVLSEQTTDKISLRSLSTHATLKSDAYFTAPEFQSDDDEDWDRTLTEESIQRPDELGDLPSSSFNRSMPHRMSSFKRSDPTVPINSPLYASRLEDDRSMEGLRSPKPVPPPRISTNKSNQ